MKSKEILIIEDDFDIREILKMSLEMEGYKVLTASNGVEGLSILSKFNHPCLILLDLMMPVMDGWTFAAEVEKDPTLGDIPIVLVTAYSEKAKSIKRAMGLIPKPIDFNTLIHTVKVHCCQ